MPVCPIDSQYHGGIAPKQAENRGVQVITEAMVYPLTAMALALRTADKILQETQRL